MRCCLFVLLFFLLYSFPATAQETADSLRGVELKSVTIRAVPELRYATGSRISLMDSSLLATLANQSLATLLAWQSPVYIKEYGQGMLGSVAFRGMGASHTALLWNGININQPTLGQSDLSLMPLFLFDQVELIHGSAGALLGSDAVGGSVLLETRQPRKAGSFASIRQQSGSFGTHFTGMRAGHSSARFSSLTQLFRHSSVNNFRFKDITKAGAPLARQENASVLHYGFTQDLYYQLASGVQLSLKGWYNTADRQIQSTMGATGIYDVQADESIRVLASAAKSTNRGQWQAKTGYIRDYLLFNERSLTITSRYIGAFQYDAALGKKHRLHAGTTWTYINTRVDNYTNNPDEHRNDLFLLWQWQPMPRLLFSVNWRQGFVSRFSVPAAPSAGAEYLLVQQATHSIRLKALASRSYRVPSLNDRFWSPGGKPDIRPERGWNIESGVVYHQKGQHWKLHSELSAYYQHMDDWIIWLPTGSFWSPDNIRQVKGHGLEWSGNANWQSGLWQLSIGSNYAYTRSINQGELNLGDRTSGKQLAYTPIHKGSAQSMLQYGNGFVQWLATYTGSRFVTADNESSLPAFMLHQLVAGYNYRKGRHQWTCSAQINNLLNTSYQNLRLRAMPGRYFQTTLQWSLLPRSGSNPSS